MKRQMTNQKYQMIEELIQELYRCAYNSQYFYPQDTQTDLHRLMVTLSNLLELLPKCQIAIIKPPTKEEIS